MSSKQRWDPRLCKRCGDYILTKGESFKFAGNFYHTPKCPDGGTFDDLLRRVVGGEE